MVDAVTVCVCEIRLLKCEVCPLLSREVKSRVAICLTQIVEGRRKFCITIGSVVIFVFPHHW